MWEVEYTDEFAAWWNSLTVEEQKSVTAFVDLLEDRSVHLGYPHCSRVNGSRHAHMRELRVQHQGDPYRILYAFDPRRNAILLMGGNKAGDDRWYETFVPIADRLYDEHLVSATQERRVTVMAKPFRLLRDKLPPEARARTNAMLEEIALQELRKALNLTQEQVAEAMKLNQGVVSKMEHQSDIYVSTLRKFVTAMGGQLKLVASFPDREVVINQFD